MQRRTGEPAALAGVVFAGALLSLQVRINGDLGTRMGSVLVAALVSFLIGGVVLLALVGGTATGRAGVRRLRAGPSRWWWWLGGVSGAAVVTVSTQGAPELGVSLVSVCVVAGAVAGGLVVDRLGFGPSGRQRLSGRRLAGAGIAVAAVCLGAIGDRSTTFRPLLLAAITVAGFATAAQQAANGQVSRAAGDARVAALVNFAVGSAVLIGIVLLAGFGGGVGSGVGEPGGVRWPAAAWLYSGGLAGAAYVVLSAATVARLGVLRLTLATVAGQLLGSLALDVVVPVAGRPLSAATVAGVLLTLGAVAVASVPGRAVTQRQPTGGPLQ